MTTPDRTEILKRLRSGKPSQEHVLRFWDSLTAAQREHLANQVMAIDFALISEILAGTDNAPDWSALASKAESPPAIRLSGPNRYSKDEAIRRGAELLHEGKVGMMLVAGGQGTRLGFPHPKGMFPIGPVSDRTLFQIIIEHLSAIGQRHGVRIPLYVMTSFATHDETIAFLNQHDRFGLRDDDLVIFAQGSMSAFDAATGRLLLDEPGSLALSPDGHGGMLSAFVQSGGLAHAESRGVEQLYYGQIDNPLLQVCSPELLGYHSLAKSEMTTQVVRKRDPMERVGNVVSVDGVVRIIEYSDLAEAPARRTNKDGSLALWAGNIAVHVLDLAFLRRAAADSASLPFHRALKKVPFVDDKRQRVEPREPNALKFEKFIFDLLPLARNALVVEADPADAFAPVKNAEGEKTDTAATARAAMVALHTRWLREAGVEVESGVSVEISPELALNADEAKRRLGHLRRIASPTFLRQVPMEDHEE